MNVAIIAAGGRGVRMGGEEAKQFRELGGTPIIIHTLRRFERCKTVGEVMSSWRQQSQRLSGAGDQYALTKLRASCRVEEPGNRWRVQSGAAATQR